MSHEHLLFPLVDKLKQSGERRELSERRERVRFFPGFLCDDLVYTGKHDEEAG